MCEEIAVVMISDSPDFFYYFVPFVIPLKLSYQQPLTRNYSVY